MSIVIQIPTVTAEEEFVEESKKKENEENDRDLIVILNTRRVSRWNKEFYPCRNIYKTLAYIEKDNVKCELQAI